MKKPTLPSKQHPDQKIQEEWMKWLKREKYTYVKYLEFMLWRDAYLKLNPLD
jgi:hypothetical protein